MLCEHGNIAPCVACDIEPLKAENEALRATMAGLVDALERALDFIRGDGNSEHREPLELCECYSCVTGEIIDSLAAHRKQGGGVCHRGK